MVSRASARRFCSRRIVQAQAELARGELEAEVGEGYVFSDKLETEADVDYERSRYYEFVLLRSKNLGINFIAMVFLLPAVAVRQVGRDRDSSWFLCRS